MEHWRDIEDFPGYEISDEGRVRNAAQYILGIYSNGRGFRQVVMWRDGKNNARAVHKLVARAFLDDPPDESYIPMHISGDRDDCTVDNLEYKPLWYVQARTKQSRRTRPVDPRPVRAKKTGVIFPNALEAAKEIGGLENLVILTAQNKYDATYMGTSWEFL